MAKGKRVAVSSFWPTRQIFSKPGKRVVLLPTLAVSQRAAIPTRVGAAELRRGPAPCSEGTQPPWLPGLPFLLTARRLGVSPLGRRPGAFSGLGEKMRRWEESTMRRPRQHMLREGDQWEGGSDARGGVLALPWGRPLPRHPQTSSTGMFPPLTCFSCSSTLCKETGKS